MEQQKRVTIKELSKLMGVSTTTITNALTGQPNVSEKKREEIIKKLKSLATDQINMRGLWLETALKSASLPQTSRTSL